MEAVGAVSDLSSRCLACGNDRADVCAILGHVYPVEYKANGAQLQHAPDAKGIPYDEWIKRYGSSYDPAEVKEFYRALEVKVEPKPAKKRR